MKCHICNTDNSVQQFHHYKKLESNIKPTNLNMLFQQMIINFAHLVDIKPLTKDEFLKKVHENYSLENAKTHLFYHSTIQSEFDTIRLSNDRNSLLFNQ
jgi:hypothetical protein